MYELVQRVRHLSSRGGEAVNTRVRCRSGRWLEYTVTTMDGGTVAALLTQATSDQLLAHTIRWFALTKRESEVLHLSLAGLSRKQVAKRAGVSTYTVAEHLSGVYRKTGATGLQELTARLW